MTSIRPNKRLGQNFLRDKRALERILEAAELFPLRGMSRRDTSQDTVVEIGPGIGTLTLELAQRAKKVIAIEKDPKMVEILKETLKSVDNVEIIQEDVLKHEIRNAKYKVIANLPYYITSPVIRKFLEAKHKPKLMVLMVQKEVAQRICAKPPHMSLLAVSVQFYAKPEIVAYVSKNSFWPVPKVDSAILRITLKHAEPYAEPRRFFTIVKAGFKQPRKQLGNNLRMLGLPKEQLERFLKQAGVQPSQRAETLPVKTWVSLANNLKKYTP